MAKKKILCFFGTRPEAIKMAPVVRALKDDRAFEPQVVVSAQHRGLLDQVLDLFDIPVKADLNLMKDGQTLTDITADGLRRFEPVLKRLKPDLVLVHGDTSTTFAGALASYYLKIPVGHVEAGLRTGDRYRPFPEEINRLLTDSISTLYFAPTAQARAHLLKENKPDRDIFVTGNTVIDALLWATSMTRPLESPELKRSLRRIGSDPIILMTAHRRENFGTPFRHVLSAVNGLSRAFPKHHWVYPVHPNPNVAGPARRVLKGRPNVHLLNPLGYGDLAAVMSKSVLVVTDSGGIQEEAPALGKPVLVLREVTERPEAVDAGTVKLVGTDPQKLMSGVSTLLKNAAMYRKMANAVNPYGDGRASERIVAGLRWYFGLSPSKPKTFVPR